MRFVTDIHVKSSRKEREMISSCFFLSYLFVPGNSRYSGLKQSTSGISEVVWQGRMGNLLVSQVALTFNHSVNNVM